MSGTAKNIHGIPVSGALGALIAPPSGAFAVTSSNTASLGTLARKITINGAGNLRLGYRDGSSVTFESLAPHHTVVGFIDQVYETGTSATTIIAEY